MQSKYDVVQKCFSRCHKSIELPTDNDLEKFDGAGLGITICWYASSASLFMELISESG